MARVIMSRNDDGIMSRECVESQAERSISLHVRQHFRPAGSEKANEKKGRNGQKNDVQNARVIEADRHFDNLSAAMRRDQPECFESKFN
jgi:hypothetical protein